MKKLLLTLSLSLCLSAQAATSFTEFYCNSTGTNINAGSTTNAAALFTESNGNWDATTGVFTCSGGDDLSAITVGMWASVYTDGATVGVFVGRITAVDDGADTITVSVTIKTGTPPGTSATGITIKVGGAWKGPYGSQSFPFNFCNERMTNTSLNVPRINFKAETDYVITATMTHSSNGPIRWQGYTNTVGDGGKAAIKDTATAASYTLFSPTGINNDYADFIFSASFSSGTSDGITSIGAECTMTRIVVHDVRRSGFQSTSICTLQECEAYNCNASNTGNNGGFAVSGVGSILVRCISHDNSTANGVGYFVGSGAMTIMDCIADSNGSDGFSWATTTSGLMSGCDSYNNGGDGLDLTASSTAQFVIQNCNFINNTGFGITSSGSSSRNGSIFNCGFGSGTQANDAGSMASNLGGLNEIGTITYAANVTPWTDPANGDFRINLATARNTGRGVFTQTATSYAGTVSYPDVGAAQATNDASGGTVVAYPIFRR